MDLLAFQFNPQVLFGGKPNVSATRTLAPGASLYLATQTFTFPGQPESLRVTVDFEGKDADAVTSLPLQYGSAPGKFRFPLKGNWIAGAGSTLHSHHRWVVPEEFAFDFVRFGASGSTYAGTGSRPEDYYAYGQPVSAVAEGEVVVVRDGIPDSVGAMRRADETLTDYQKRLRENQGAMLAQGVDVIPGNHVIVRHADGVYSVSAHLKPGSIKVKVGDLVKEGQVIAAVGTSGNSTEPHLHFHLCDGPSGLNCAGMPIEFYNVEIPISDSPRQIQTGDLLVPKQ
ncbi:MAG: M23 family metallopeptidase [Arenimonas sp.]